ncbi:MAG: hypothetical protein ACTS5I_14925, partial [Rhodanobacter sp.]
GEAAPCLKTVELVLFMGWLSRALLWTQEPIRRTGLEFFPFPPIYFVTMGVLDDENPAFAAGPDGAAGAASTRGG